MENLKTYRIDSDIASQSLNPAKLSNEINDSLSVNGLEAINTEGNFFHIIGTSIENESSLDQVVNEHVSLSQSDDLLSKYVKYEKDGKKYFNEISSVCMKKVETNLFKFIDLTSFISSHQLSF